MKATWDLSEVSLQLPVHLNLFPKRVKCFFKNSVVQIPASFHLLLRLLSLQDSGPFGLLVIQMQNGYCWP